MSEPRKPQIFSRKEPKQTRSKQLVDDILEAAGRVLAREGAHRFTAARVAEETGISVGSLYQYFPNKQAILFKLQSDEWIETSNLLAAILGDKSIPAMTRLRKVVIEFVRSEREEAQMRKALDDAAPLYRDAPEAIELRRKSERYVGTFFEEVLPNASESEHAVVVDVTMISLKAVGKYLSEADLTPHEVELRTHGLADMFCAYFESYFQN